MSASVTIWPVVGLVDDPIQVLATGLRTGQSVTIVAILTDNGMTFGSAGQFLSDDQGEVDVRTTPSTGGTYTGIEPMGLLWSMRSAPGQKHGLRLMKKDVSEPFLIEVFLVDGHVDVLVVEDLRRHEVLSRRTIERFYQAPDVITVPVKERSIRGMLFLPHGKGPFPGVIDMFGTAGGLTLYRAALFASRGFAAFALAYFNFDDLPPNIELQIEYFKDAVDWFHSHPLVSKNGIGVVGVSKGGALAMEMAILSNKVKAVVAINPYCRHCIGIHYYKGQSQPVVNANLADLYETHEGLVYAKAYEYNGTNDEAIIRVEEAETASFLFVIGGGDATSDSRETKILIDRLRRRHRDSKAVKDRVQLLSYPGAGHLIEPPYTPHFRCCYTKLVGTVCVYGGETKAHSVAQEDSWRQTLRFLRWNLMTQPNIRTTTAETRRQQSSPFSKL